jgi:pimeloyl-ACP methyl ester carboxylesterase
MGGEQSVSVNQSVGEIAGQLCAAYARQDVAGVFTVESDGAKKRARILRRPTAAGVATNFMDVYTVDYQNTLTNRFESSRDLVKMLLILLLTVGSGVRMLRSVFLGWKGKTWKEKVQFLFLGQLLKLFWVYLILLGVALFNQVQVYDQVKGNATKETVGRQTAPSTAKQDSETADKAKKEGQPGAGETNKDTSEKNQSVGWAWWSSTAVVVLALLGLTIPPDWKAQFGRLMGSYYSAYEYINYGRTEAIVGLLENRLREVTELERYARVHVVAYSFGSVVAFNAFFPRNNAPLPRFAGVDTLVFIGCPVDPIRAFWPKYFHDRKNSPQVPKRWVNVYRMDDIMSSNFNDDRKASPQPSADVMRAIFSPPSPPAAAGRTTSQPDGTRAVIPAPDNISILSGADDREFSLVETFTLYGFAAHTGYWHSGNPQAPSAFDEVVTRL